MVQRLAAAVKCLIEMDQIPPYRTPPFFLAKQMAAYQEKTASIFNGAAARSIGRYSSAATTQTFQIVGAWLNFIRIQKPCRVWLTHLLTLIALKCLQT